MAEKVLIRRGKVADVQGLSILSEQLGYPVSAEEVEERLQGILQNPEHVVYVAEATNGTVVGYIHAHLYRLIYAEMMLEIDGVVVEKEYRLYGIGSQLVKEIEEWGKTQNCTLISLRSNILRRGAHQFYERLGYNKAKTQFTFRKLL